MATALVVADLDLAADVGGNGATEVTLDLVVAFDVITQRDEVLVGELVDTEIRRLMPVAARVSAARVRPIPKM